MGSIGGYEQKGQQAARANVGAAHRHGPSVNDSQKNMRLPLSQVKEYASRYPKNHDDGLLARTARIQKSRSLTLDDLCAVCDWKSPRSAGHARKNKDADVAEISSFALQAKGEKSRIESLLMLHGVSYPTASVILHFYHSEKYPIIDFRAIWTLSLHQPKFYDFEYCWEFVSIWRSSLDVAKASYPELSAREFDCALWQYSKENQNRT